MHGFLIKWSPVINPVQLADSLAFPRCVLLCLFTVGSAFVFGTDRSVTVVSIIVMALRVCAVLLLLLPACLAHIRLTWPEARYPQLDFLDNVRTATPCGVRFSEFFSSLVFVKHSYLLDSATIEYLAVVQAKNGYFCLSWSAHDIGNLWSKVEVPLESTILLMLP